MKNLFIIIALLGIFTLNTQAQFTKVKVNLSGTCKTPNSNSRYVIKVEILNISVTPHVAVITPVINTYATEGFPSVGVTIDINETDCTPDGNNNIYKVYVSAAKVWWPNGPIECDGKATDQPEKTCWGLINEMPTYGPIVVELE